MIKVLHIIQTLGIGGMENRVARLAGGLQRSGYSISVVTLRPQPSRSITLSAGVNVTLLEIPPGIHLGKLFSLAKFIRGNNFQIVHTHNWSTMFYGILAGKLAGSAILIHGEHGINFEDLAGIPWKRLMSQKVLGYLSDHIVAVHDAMAKSIILSWKVNPMKVTAIPNGVDLSRFKFGERISNEYYIIGTVGRLDKVKNFTCLITAFSFLKKKYPHRQDLRLVFVGDGPCKASLSNDVLNLGLSDSVLFVGDVERPEEWYQKISVFVNCSFSEGMSNTILEAMASGIPIVASDIEGNASWLESGRNALFFKSDSALDLAESLSVLVENQNLSKEMGRINRLRVEEDFDNRHFLERYRTLYERLIPHLIELKKSSTC